MPGTFWRLSLLTNEYNSSGPFLQPPNFRTSSVSTGAVFSQDYPPLHFFSVLAPLALQNSSLNSGLELLFPSTLPQPLGRPWSLQSPGLSPTTPFIYISRGHNVRNLGPVPGPVRYSLSTSTVPEIRRLCHRKEAVMCCPAHCGMETEGAGIE